jgi:NAD(P)-dependent dehydrogenase (short-subunit alcohol dehydrogenase family)
MASHSSEIADQTVMITGAGRGLGRELAYEFRSRGCYVILVCRTAPATIDLDDHIYLIMGDICDPWVVKELGLKALEHKVSILINNAGVHDRNMTGEEVDVLRRVIDVNMIAPALVTQAVWPALVESTCGMVVNINSLAGLEGSARELSYAASKHGLAGMAKCLQFDGTRDNVRILTVYLGAMKTDMSSHRQDYDRLIEPADAARLIVNLCENYTSLRVTEVTVARRNY